MIWVPEQDQLHGHQINDYMFQYFVEHERLQGHDAALESPQLEPAK